MLLETISINENAKHFIIIIQIAWIDTGDGLVNSGMNLPGVQWQNIVA